MWCFLQHIFCTTYIILSKCDAIHLVSFQTSSDFDAKPMVMLLGQYSTGKTTFIKHLLKCSYPGFSLVNFSWDFCLYVSANQNNLMPSSFIIHTGAHIGPEPTTDRFVVVMVYYSELCFILLFAFHEFYAS